MIYLLPEIGSADSLLRVESWRSNTKCQGFHCPKLGQINHQGAHILQVFGTGRLLLSNPAGGA